MKAVVTGAAGFIGSHLAERLLSEGQEVVGVDAFVDYYPRSAKEANLASAREQPAFRLVEAALQELELRPLLEGADCVYHLAAQAGVRTSWGRDFGAYTDHNVLATQRLFEAASEAGVRRVVMASSSSVYGDSTELPLRESSPCRPVSPYGVTKLACEHLAYLYARDRDLDVIALRYFTVFGPRQRPDMAFHRFLRAARDRTPIHVYGDGRQTRDFTFVDDLVDATRRAADAGRSGVYNVGGGQRVALNDVLRTIETITAQRLDVVRDPAQPGDMRDTHADTTAAVRDLGFRATVGLEEGLRREWDWVRGQA